MNWINIETKILRAPEFVGCEPQQRATWFNLLAYCVEQENGGVILQCNLWKDRRWQQTCGITIDEVLDACDLWSWKKDSLAIWGYPIDKENEVRLKREGGQRGGKARAKNAADKAIADNATSIATANPSSSASSIASTEEKRIGKEEKEREALPLPLSDFSEEIPSGNLSTMDTLAAKACSVRPGWSRIALSYAERQSIVQNSNALQSMSESDWELIRKYMSANLPQGSAGWQPQTRSRFIENIADVLGHALNWQSKRTPAPSVAQAVAPIKIVTAQERAQTMHEFNQLFGNKKGA